MRLNFERCFELSLKSLSIFTQDQVRSEHDKISTLKTAITDPKVKIMIIQELMR